MSSTRSTYHHGNLAEALLDEVDAMAGQFGLDAVSLRACAKRAGVSPSSAFRHFSDKRDLMTAFATRAIHRLADALEAAGANAEDDTLDPFMAVALTYVRFAVEQPALFRAMWREEALYTQDEAYTTATNRLSARLAGGFAGAIVDKDPDELDEDELLAWSAVHGLANLLIDGPVGKGRTRERRLRIAESMLETLAPVFDRHEGAAATRST